MANEKKPVPANKKKPEQANKAKKLSAQKTRPAAKKKTKAAPKKRARVSGTELLRRILIAALALLIVFGVVLSAVSLHEERLQKKITRTYSGLLQQECLFPIDLDEEQVRQNVRATKRRGQTRAFTYFCNDTLQLDAQSMSGYILFGNPADNDCTLVLSVTDENDRLIYCSDGVSPGKYITMVRPLVPMESGTHACKAYVAAYKGRDERYKCVGVQYSRLTVEVGGSS